MRTMQLASATIVAIGLSAFPVMGASDCTDNLFEAKRGAVTAYLNENPYKASKVDAVAKSVEKEYYGGNMPPEDKRCESMDKLLTALKAL